MFKASSNRSFSLIARTGCRSFCGSAYRLNVLAKAQNVITTKAEKDISDTKWVQELLDKTEGGGYIVADAGLLAHKVTWGDQDTFQHVNNVVYLKWFETARVNYYTELAKRFPDKDMKDFMKPIGLGPIMRSADIAWRHAIKYPDEVTVIHKIMPLTEPDRFTLKGVVVSHKAKKVAARISEVTVIVDYDKGGVKAPIPDNVREVFEIKIAEQNGQKEWV